MPSVIFRRNEQAVSPDELALAYRGRHDTNCAAFESQEAYLTSVLNPELIRLREMNTPASRRILKMLMFLMLREVCKVPIDTIRQVFTIEDHPPIGLATTDRWTESAENYLRQRKRALSTDLLVAPVKKPRESVAEKEFREELELLAREDFVLWREQWEHDYERLFGKVPSRNQAYRKPKPTEVASPEPVAVDRQLSLFGGP